MNKNFTFSFQDLKSKIGHGSIAVRKLPAKIRDSARFYYTFDGELRVLVGGNTFAWTARKWIAIK